MSTESYSVLSNAIGGCLRDGLPLWRLRRAGARRRCWVDEAPEGVSPQRRFAARWAGPARRHYRLGWARRATLPTCGVTSPTVLLCDARERNPRVATAGLEQGSPGDKRSLWRGAQGALLPPAGAAARRHTRIRAGGSAKHTSLLARSGTTPQRFLHRTLGRKVGWSFPECAHLAQHRIMSLRRRGSLRARSSCQVVAHHRNDGGAPTRARYRATSGSRHRYGGGADPGERGPRLHSRGALEGARGNRWPPRGSEARHRRGARSSRSTSATRAYESTRATEGACQTPAGQRPQSVVFKLRSRLGDSARPEQSTTRRICLRLPVAQPTAVGDARQEPPLRISRAAGYGERYGRAAGTQDKKKELSSYAFCPISFVESFHGFLRQCPSRSLMKITPSPPNTSVILFDVLVASAYYIESCCTCVLLII